MQPVRRNVIAITVAGVLTLSAPAALADAARGKPFEGVVVDGVVVVEQFPAEVQTGSIAVQDALAAKAGITSSEAAQIAQKALPGNIVQTRLDEENGYLIWEVEVIGDKAQEVQLKIDAGDGRLLAIEAGEKGDREHHDGDREDHDEGEHRGWKFWEHDRDERDAECG